MTIQNKTAATDPDFLRTRVDLVKAFCETAKIYIQLSAAALALPILFTQAVLGKEAAERGLRSVGVPCTLVLAWISFLAAIACGLTYQWLIVRLVWDELHEAYRTAENADRPGFRKTRLVFQPGFLNRSYLYGGMVGFFFLGAILFLVFAAMRLRN